MQLKSKFPENFTVLYLFQQTLCYPYRCKQISIRSSNCQDDKSIAFYNRKLNSAQVYYITTEQELLSTVETLET